MYVFDHKGSDYSNILVIINVWMFKDGEKASERGLVSSRECKFSARANNEADPALFHRQKSESNVRPSAEAVHIWYRLRQVLQCTQQSGRTCFCAGDTAIHLHGASSPGLINHYDWESRIPHRSARGSWTQTQSNPFQSD
jgi:hypothetical protein